MARSQLPSVTNIAARVLVAVFGTYAAIYAGMFALARLLPLRPADAVLATSMLSFLLGVPLLLWIFAERSLARVAVILGAAMIVFTAVGVVAG